MSSEKLACTMNMVAIVLLFHTLTGIALGNNNLDDLSGIRLANGTEGFSGRVEVSINGVWGTVCDDSFDMDAANVMCRMMNLKATSYASGAYFGQGIGPIFAQQFKCNGDETHLRDCEFVPNVECTHTMDIGLFCTECGEIDISNGDVVSISQNGKVLTMACKEGFKSEIIESICEAGVWSESEITCTSNIADLRLANGIGLYDGRIEILVNGTWGTICSTSFTWPETSAICRILFFGSSRTYMVSSIYYGAGTGPVLIDNLDCDGSETDINECSYSLDVTCSDHSHDAAVACNVFPLNITNTRLSNDTGNGTGLYEGRFELFVDGHWGTIDRRYVDLYDAQTICNTHGGSLAMYYDTAKYGEGTGPILVNYIDCKSKKNDINSCTMSAPYRYGSSHQYDLSIVCTPCGLPDIYNGDPVAFTGNELTVRCQTGFSPNQVTMKCLGNNTWSKEQKCTPDYGYPLNISVIQLNNGQRPSEGRVEIMVNGEWGTICDTTFDSADATVICKMFGLKYSRYYVKAGRYGRGTGPIYVNNLNCTGTESHINQCSYDISNNCTHYDDVAVECTGADRNIRLEGYCFVGTEAVRTGISGSWITVLAVRRHSLGTAKTLTLEPDIPVHTYDQRYQLNLTNIRLAGTSGPNHGRVEIEVNGTEWGTICQNHFSSSDARVICRMLGLTYKAHYYNAHYGPGSGPIYVDRLYCSSSYSHINDCRYAVNNYYSCSHNQDISVMCYGPTLNITGARLVNGTSVFDGRAEIKVDDKTWGTICDENFNFHAADLFCNMFGYRAAQFFTGAYYGEGSGPVFIDQLFCDEHDTSLSSCQYLFLNECSHERDISIVCNECGQPDIAFWGVDFFTYNDTTLYADCSYYKTYVGRLKLTCDNQTQTWKTEGECQEYRFPLTITGIQLADGPSKTKGRVELESKDTWGTVCDDSFGMQEADALCRMLGYPPAVTYYTGAHYGQGKGPIFVDDLDCDQDASHINDCSYSTYDDCSHSDDVSVVCTDCGDPTPENGYVSSSMTNYGAAVYVTCENHHNLIGDFEIICQINGSWSNMPTCKRIDCGNPEPANGNINTTSTTNATVASVWCDEGYTLSGDSVITCQPNETWTYYPTCDINDCKDPTPTFADVTLLGNKTTYGETAVVSCWTGYTPTGNTPVPCLANGTWGKWPDCEIVDCGNPVPQKGSANSSATTYDTVLEVTCDTGYNLTGESDIRCQADGSWTDYPVCDTTDCGKFSVANGEVNTTLGTAVGSTVSVECDEGYDIQGSSAVSCTATGWNESITCQIQVCEDPTPDHGKLTDTDGKDGFVFGNYADVECNTGYDMEGDNVITCENGGKWNERPTCELIDCGGLTGPVDGNIDNTKGTKYGAKITFNCNEDFLLVGDATTMCGANGKWSSQVPTCVRKSEDSGYCLGDEYCLMEGSRCIDSTCKCITGIYDTRTKKCDKMPLLPYGNDKGDKFISDTDVCGPTISFAPGLPVSGKMRKKMFVCSYGFVTFDTIYTYPAPPGDKDDVFSIGQEIILAPFYAGINKKTSGPVYYRMYDILNAYDKMKDDAELVNYIESIVQKFGGFNSYDASFILIATWHETKSIGFGFNTEKTSTFQAVLVSDGKSTYVFYIYGHGLMNWDDNDSINTQVWVGTKVAYDVSLSVTHPLSFTSAVLHLDAQPEAPSTEDDVAGVFFEKLNHQGIEYQNNAVDCIRWYNENYEEKKHLDYIASLTPECPCDIWLSRFDPWFWKIGLQRRRTDVKFACVDMLHAGNYGHYGKSCCYDLKTWLWVYERPHAGSFQLYNPRFQREYELNDQTPKNQCCLYSDYCNLYYELRPTGSCYLSSSYTFGTFWGDPHFITLDRMNFTFNGLGEYTLLQVRTHNLTFDLQARTERAIKKDGNVSDATVFSAFAVKDSSNASLHVELNKAKTGMILFGNNVDLTKQFYTTTDPEDPFVYTTDEGNLVISKRDETVSVLFPTSGISLNISASVEMLSLNTGVPVQLRGLTEGLLGNYDGNPGNDFTMANGTVLETNLTEREVFEYGKTWSILGNNSAFIYEDGKSHIDFHNDSYIPRFLDEADPDKRAEAEKACNGSQNIECVFDFVFTEKMEIADQTTSIKGESVSTSVELEVTVPSLTGCDVILAEIGSTVYCNITADPGNEVIFRENSVNATFDPASTSISYFQTTDEPVDIRVSSKNDYGRYSPEFVVDIVLCDCNGHGVCTNQTREDTRATEHFKYAQCECEPQYKGNSCEADFDGCAASPCSLGRNCSSLTAVEQKAQNRSYICGACPDGFIENDEDECIDVNECMVGLHTCEHNCINTEGSYSCRCKDGFRVDSRNNSKCKDGSCNESEKNACSNTSGCTLVDGQPECFCTDGYELDESEEFCQDIDECSRGICPHDCLNTNGSFQCVCFTGFQLQDSTTCTACRVPKWGTNCEQTCACTGRGADRCDTVKGCICKTGWHGETCNQDINECSSSLEMCDDPRKTCANNLGSYQCVCKTGFHLTETDECEDLDECAVSRLNKCTQDCTNTLGSYSCKCKDGYTKYNETACTDIDECELGIDKCEQRCTNNVGLYTCACWTGYTLNDDRQTCTKLSDPCFTVSNLNCSQLCLLSEEDATCGCQKGYDLESDNETCTDINECGDNDANKCDSSATCINTAGSFDCECPVGSQLENDGRTCSECDDYHYGKNCLQNCSCLYGKCDKTKGCVCDDGWAGNNCDIEINECETKQVVCTAENTVCINLRGGAICSCDTGYRNNSGLCEDIDECADTLLNSCDQKCVNTNGSYTCICESGFVIKDGMCTDTDECFGSHGCDQICENTVGSYICSCENGFKLDLKDRKSCIPENECTDDESKSCTANSSCFVNNDVVSCTCMKGFLMNGDYCEDADECREDVNPCSQKCTNTDGSFVCTCDVGYHLQDDLVTCEECSAWKYGHECENVCSCDKSKSELCSSEAGMCVCKSGWNGTICDEDVDECMLDTACPGNSKCNNSAGSFECTCNKGYIKTGAQHCEECDDRHFGERCLEECICSIENSKDCHHETGECVCKQGWSGTDCAEDVEECSVNSSICDSKANSFCRNNVGSFDCICKAGFTEENGNCIDVNECLDSDVNKCDQICVNTPGGFVCDCEAGFKMQNKVCTECEENTFGLNCSEECVCDINTTLSCDRVNGSCYCKEGWNGTTCSLDINECAENITLCEKKAHSTCKNEDGSYTCACDYGFRDHAEVCKACESWTYGFNCESNCTCEIKNTETCDAENGDCMCKTGWNGTNCDNDINECANKSLCPEYSACVNYNGSFACICDTGYIKSDENICKECVAFTYGDECSKNCTCNIDTTQICDHVDGSCTCTEGWKGAQCLIDIDECTENVTICEVKANSTCKNENGSYSCICNTGLREEDGICTDCDEWKFGQNCESNCICNTTNTKFCNPKTGKCTCDPGWNGTSCRDDVNECDTEDICQMNASCENVLGSFECKCNKGFSETESGQCDACKLWTYGFNCESNCTCEFKNTETCDAKNGDCTCKTGWNGTNCDNDINECANRSLCPEYSSCVNYNGSFACVCDTGYIMSDENICKECVAFTYGDECSKTCTCNVNTTQVCDHIDGSCTCTEGWKGAQCLTDIDECTENVTICEVKANSTCKNEKGSYHCICNNGFREEDEICTDCDEWKFGENCESNCVCDTTKTKFCNPKTGRCTCKPGWNGTSCQDDVNECDTEDICQMNASCENALGSFECKCNKGFSETESGQCDECTGNTYGVNCSLACNCNASNAVDKDQTCKLDTGICECKGGWDGDTCNVDVNECNDTTACIAKNNTTCVNTLGSFLCDCLRGFINGSEGNCVKDIRPTTSTPDQERSFSHNITIDTDLPADINLDSAIIYSNLQNEIEPILRRFFQRYTQASLHIIVNDIRIGSIIVDYTVVYGSTTMDVASKLTKAVLDLEQGSEITLFGRNVSVSSDAYKDMEPCEVYHILVGNCEQGYQCKTENNTPICRLKEDESDVNWSLAIGLSGAGICLVIIATTTAVYLRHLNRKQKIKKHGMLRARSGLYGDDIDGSAVGKVHRWRDDIVTNHERRIPDWREKLTSPNFRAYDNNAYSQPYQIPRDRPAGYSTDRDRDRPAGYSNDRDRDRPAGYSTGRDRDRPAGYSTDRDRDRPAGYSIGRDRDRPAGYGTDRDRDRPAEYSTDRDRDRLAGYTTDRDWCRLAGYTTDWDRDRPAKYSTDRDRDRPAGYSTDRDRGRPAGYSTDVDRDRPVEYSTDRDRDRPAGYTTARDRDRPAGYSTGTDRDIPAGYSTGRDYDDWF